MNAAELADRLDAKKSGAGWMARCPVHDDHTPSLSISDGDNGCTLIHCHAGCASDAVLAALHLTMVDLAPPKLNGHDETHYRYPDEAGTLLFEVVRKPGKKFLQRRPDGMGGWIWKLGDTRRVLYDLPSLIKAVASDSTIFIPEGEKDADRIIAEGYRATTNPGGAGKWGKVAAHAQEVLKGADVIVVRDMDEPGLAHASEVVASLRGVAKSVMMVEPVEGKDVSDHLAAGHTLDDLVEVVEVDPDAPVSLDELVDTDEEPYQYLVENLIEVGDRIIVTGGEGKGKSTLLRQLGVQVAHGIHPFDDNVRIDPVRVLVVDCENSRRQVRRKAGGLRKAKGAPVWFKFRPEGVDLTTVEHVAWLERMIKKTEPQLLVIGPVYKMAGGDPKDEQNAKAVATTIDTLRMLHNFAVIMEAHSPYADGSRSKRPERPYGASLWSRWPEFGIYLADDGTLRHWRGQRDERQWPKKLKRGETWPWEVDIAAEVEVEAWHGPTHCMADVRDFLTRAGTEYSGYALHNAMKATGLNYRRDTITQAAEALALEGAITVRSGARNARLFSVKQEALDDF